MSLVLALGALILVCIIIVAIYILIKAVKYLAVNAIVGLILLAILKWVGVLSKMEIGLWDLVLTAIGGVIGVFIIVLLYYLGYDI